MAGSIATGVNGSRLGYGAIQNMIRGLHFVTAPDRSVYVEPASRPVLSDAAALVFADEVIRDDAIFDGCLVHLGGMGVVNGLVVELDVKRLFAVQRVRHQVDRNWLDQISRGIHQVACGEVDCNTEAEPLFVPAPALFNAFFQNPGCERMNQAGEFCNGNKIIGWHKTQFRMDPTNQCLESVTTSFIENNFWLVVKAQLVFTNCPP